MGRWDENIVLLPGKRRVGWLSHLYLCTAPPIVLLPEMENIRDYLRVVGAYDVRKYLTA